MSTEIQWTHQDGYIGETWNPIAAFNLETGKRGWMCTKPSAGCKHCYAEAMNRFRGNGLTYTVGSLDRVRLELVNIEQPIHWRKPRVVFVCSMTDLFHEQHSDTMIDAVFTTMAKCQRHVFIVLTKRPARMRDYCNARLLGLPLPNVRLGTTVENQQTADERIPALLATPAVVRFLSCEPLLSAIDFRGAIDQVDNTGDYVRNRIDWVICGGESGAGARVLDVEWIYDIIAQCEFAGVPCFVKQLGRRPVRREHGVVVWPEVDLIDKHGGDPAEWPEDLRVREFPAVAASV